MKQNNLLRESIIQRNIDTIGLINSNLKENYRNMPSYVSRYLLILTKKNVNSIFILNFY